MATQNKKTPAKAATPKPKAKSAGAKSGATAKASKKPSQEQESLKAQAAQFREAAKERVKSAAESGKEKASDAMGSASTVIEDVAATLDEKLGVQYGDYARKAADTISGMADSLRGKGVEDLLDNARDFVRKKPAVAIGAAAAVGFLLTRLIRANDDDEA